MNAKQLTAFGKSLDKLYEKHKTAISTGDTPLDSILHAISELIQADKAEYIKSCESMNQVPHTGVLGCLDSAIDGIRHAAMDYYASMK